MKRKDILHRVNQYFDKLSTSNKTNTKERAGGRNRENTRWMDKKVGTRRRQMLRQAQHKSAIAVDGKVLKGANDSAGKKTVMKSAVLHQSGVTLNQTKVDPKSNEINAVESLLEGIKIEGRVVTFMACLRNFAIGTLRVFKKTTNIASALRELAAKPYLALRLVGL